MAPRAAGSTAVRDNLDVHAASFFAKVTVLTLELDSPTLPAGKTIIFDLKDTAKLADTKKNPVIIKEGVEYK